MIANTTNQPGFAAKAGRKPKSKKCDAIVVSYFDEETRAKLDQYGNNVGILSRSSIVKNIITCFLNSKESKGG